MDIICERCQTEYDFDDALVSERGTTVKCTNCGQQFKVFRPHSNQTEPERWVVLQGGAREVVFMSLRDLQRAIANRQVARGDLLRRGDGPPRPLGAITELEPFFSGAAGARAPLRTKESIPPRTEPYDMAATPYRPAQRTDPGLSPMEALVARTGRTDRPPPGAAGAPPPAVAPPRQGARGPGHAPQRAPAPRAAAQRVDPLAGTAMGPSDPDEPEFIEEPPTEPRPFGGPAPRESNPDWQQPTMMAQEPPQRSAAGMPGFNSASASASMGASIRVSSPPYEMTPSDAPASYGGGDEEWFADPRFSGAPPGRSRALRWLVVLVVLGMLGMLGATVGRKHLDSVLHRGTAASSGDGRAATLLEEAERATADGDLDGAKEALDKASVLDDKDPKVLVLLAHWAAARADLPWLKLRVLASDDPEAIAATQRQLSDAVDRARKASDRATDLRPDDPEVVRAKVDALRLAGHGSDARGLVERLSAIASQPRTAYVLAALDLAEQAPSWPTVLDRLRVAAGGEQNLGRARAALVYALARSGDVKLAQGELDKLAALSRPYPLLSELRAFLARQNRGAAPPSAAASAPPPASAGTQVAANAAAQGAPVTGAAAGGAMARGEPDPGTGTPDDYHELLKQASQAKNGGQYDRAEQLYKSALAQNPGDTEALGGLGDIARARGNTAEARSRYEQVLARNPNYLPAVSTLADILWDSGDRSRAVTLYRRVLENTSSGPSSDRARERIMQAQGAGGGAVTAAGASDHPAAPARAPAPAAPPTTSPPSDLPPGVDISDLPGFKR